MSTKKEWKEAKVNLGSAILGAFITLLIGGIIGLNWDHIRPYVSPIKNSSQSLDWSALDEVYSQLVTNYDGDIDKTAIIEGAKKGLVDSVGDIYTTYMSASEAIEFNKSLHGDVGSGIGVVIANRDNYVRIIRTLPDNPARKAGLLSGDIIYKIDDEDVHALSSDEIATKLRGASGSQVKLTIVRDNNEKSFTLTREAINNVSADISYDGHTAIIMITRFDSDTGTLVQKFAQDFQSRGINKVIVDLRDNGGGYVSAARDLLSLWIDGDKILTQKTPTSSESTNAAHGKAILKNMKTIVLVNGSTASASEIVAGALQDYGKATILGEQTYGKGVVQTLLNLSAGSMLKVTTAHWYTPNGKTINKTGITPDEIVERTYDDINLNKDPQLDAAKKL